MIVRHDAATASPPDAQRRSAEPVRREPIAITGLACRFPGAPDVDSFWRLLADGVDSITEVPPSRFALDPIYDARPGTPGKICSRFGGFLPNVERFDSDFFGISPREAARMDPQQRILLEVAWDAIEDSGQKLEHLSAGRTGVFLGVLTSDYLDLKFFLSDPKKIDIYVGAGSVRSVAAGRLSYFLGLNGPSIVVDTACSSSLVAVHLACQSIWSGECDGAIAGGSNLVLLPQASIGFSQAAMLAPDGRCKAFDARANGFVRSDGFGLVVLKSLAAAVANADPIHAVVIGSAVNNDGRSGGLLMTPSRDGQEAVLRAAYRSAGIAPGEAQYVEAHGTGTSVGDPIEAMALGTVLAEGRADGDRCVIGSVKTNIGHCEGAAGVAGLIKTVLALRHRRIPASLHVGEPNPAIPWNDLPIRVQREPGDWPRSGRPARAGVSSFGISGTNAHVVLEEVPEPEPRAPGEPASPVRLLAISSHAPETLEATARAYREFLDAHAGEPDEWLSDVVTTAALRRNHQAHRATFAFRSREELVEQLDSMLRGEIRPGIATSQRPADPRQKIAFLFPGQGCQWVGMASRLLSTHSVFREAIERFDAAMRPHVDWSLVDELRADAKRSRLDRVDVVQPAIVGVCIALAALWRSFGVEPDAVVGQSLGEVAAAHVAGALTIEDAARVICLRSRLVRRTAGGGAMAVVGLSAEDARRALAGREDLVSVAVSTSPRSSVISGVPRAVESVIEELTRRDVFCRKVNVDYASHSAQMDVLKEELRDALRDVRPRRARLPLVSTVTARPADGAELDGDYWMRNLRETVLFSEAIQSLVRSGHDVLVEVSPHPVVASGVQQILQHVGARASVLPTLNRDEDELASLLGSLGAIHCAGREIRWSAVHPAGGRCVRLPGYVFQREEIPIRSDDDDGSPFGRRASAAEGELNHAFLRRHVRSAASPETHLFAVDFAGSDFLADHQVGGVAILPAAAYVELALAASTRAFGATTLGLESVAFEETLILSRGADTPVQLVLTQDRPGRASFQVFSGESGAAGAKPAPWTLHASGSIRFASVAPPADAEPRLDANEIRSRCRASLSTEELYGTLEGRGLRYGSGFRRVTQLFTGTGEALGRVALDADGAPAHEGFAVHPALLDGCLQVLVAAFAPDLVASDGGVYVPVSVDGIRILGPVGSEVWSHAVMRPAATAGPSRPKGDVRVFDVEGRLLIEVTGLAARRLGGGELEENGDPSRWLHEIAWRAAPPAVPIAGALPGRWLIFADRGGVGEELARRLEEAGDRGVLVAPASDDIPATGERGRARAAEIELALAESIRTNGSPFKGWIHLASLDGAPDEPSSAEELARRLEASAVDALQLGGALAKASRIERVRCVLVTRGAQAVEPGSAPIAVDQAGVWGVGRALQNEHPDLATHLVDLDGGDDRSTAARRLLEEMRSDGAEGQVVLRSDGRRYVPRLVPRAPAAPPAGASDPRAEVRVAAVPSDGPFALAIDEPGRLESLRFRRVSRRRPAAGEVEIAVEAVGLNFHDVLLAMGLLPPSENGIVEVGWECSGRVAALGDAVAGFAVGDEVTAIATSCLGSFALASAARVFPKPRDLGFEEAASFQIPFVTAHYALVRLAALAAGERVLIHTATGGVGLAAMQLAKSLGAGIFATAGTPEKRELALAHGATAVWDSRSLEFVDGVLDATGGRGVGVVLNTLSGEGLGGGLAVLASYGRFLDLSVADVRRNRPVGLRRFEGNSSYHSIDLEHLMRKRPALFETILRDANECFRRGDFAPPLLRSFPIERAEAAFRHLADPDHIGKVVVTVGDRGARSAPADSGRFRRDATYLLTGGLGGIGQAVARWMAEQGAGTLLLVGRGGAASPGVAELVSDLGERGARAVVETADVSRRDDLERVFRRADATLPPLRGVFHLAGVLDDGLVVDMTAERYWTVAAPKVLGAWHLHEMTRERSLDHFVLFSSAASVIGSPGQSNYSAANASVDALAHSRRAAGLPAQSINWGPWSEVGLAARPDRGGRLAQRGLAGIDAARGVAALGLALDAGGAQITVLRLDSNRLLQFFPGAAAGRLLSETAPFRTAGASAGIDFVALAAASGAERRQSMERYLVDQIAKVLGLSGSRLAKIDVSQPLNKLGLDSLMALEVRNRIVAGCGILIPAKSIVHGDSIAQVAERLLDSLMASGQLPPDPVAEGVAEEAECEEGVL